MLWFERRLLSIIENMWIPPCDTSLKIERAGASPGKARRLPAATTYGSQGRPDGEMSKAGGHWRSFPPILSTVTITPSCPVRFRLSLEATAIFQQHRQGIQYRQ